MYPITHTPLFYKQSIILYLINSLLLLYRVCIMFVYFYSLFPPGNSQ